MRRGGAGRALLAALAASAALFTFIAVAAPRLAPRPVLQVGPPGSARAEWVDGTPVWVVSTADGEPVVLEALNPRPWYGMDELVGWCPSQRMFQAYYDGSRFADEGQYLFGPAPAGLARYTIDDAGDNRVRVGRPIPSPGRGGSTWQQTPGGKYCFVEAGIPYAPADDSPLAEYHAEQGWDRDIVDGAIVIDDNSAAFCSELLHAEPLQCEDTPVDVVGVEASHPEGAVHVGRFVVQRRGRSYSDVVALPRGYVTYVMAGDG